MHFSLMQQKNYHVQDYNILEHLKVVTGFVVLSFQK